PNLLQFIFSQINLDLSQAYTPPPHNHHYYHSTSIDKEVQRIKKEHPDDPNAVMNDRVKEHPSNQSDGRREEEEMNPGWSPSVNEGWCRRPLLLPSHR
ncbi:hypothetical protein LINPERPRIM_LOCUS19560, partial [Linum perenne]